ncbi:MAG: PQQ-binding-like beta-propeller repeat protein [candidate division KSB1 bacterium]|nr:PQQ-binding-like beta-propeller repeat protein [candidate division KSB1 bacterium]
MNWKDLQNEAFLKPLAERLLIISGIFIAVLALLLTANYLQLRWNTPLRSPALQQLMAQLQDDPDNEALKEQIRALDLLARKAFFTRREQLRLGGRMLFVGMIVFLLSLKYLRSRVPALPDLAGQPQQISWQTRLAGSRALAWSALVLFVGALTAGILAEQEFAPKKPASVSSAAPAVSLEELRRNWPGFRGPEGAGRAYVDPDSVPVKWNGASGEGILWKTAVPKFGNCSPVVWEDRIFFTGADESSQELYCWNAATGDLLWRAEINDVPGHPKELPKVSDDTGYAAPTVATDGRVVCAIFATGDLACYDFSGKRIWAKNLGLPDNHYGHASSLIIYRDLLLVQYDHRGSRSLRAFRLTDGKLVYQTKRDDVQISWTSPLLILGADRDEVVLSSNPFVISYDPATGKELWRVKCMDGEVAPSPAFAAGRVFVVNEYARLAAIEIGADGARQIWEYGDDLSEVSSPVADERFVIMAASYGTVTCLRADTGEKVWSHDFDRGFYSSPILVGDRVYLTDLKGITHIFRMSETFTLEADNPLGEEVLTIPAFVKNRIYIRGTENLYCIGR